ncbi:MAG: hypothetical protein DI585_05470 [Pseudomonas fluorescens]|nr:MAG: hypothetical protein DI585_05470 [Pseudomonas fluorescens]
MSTTQHSVSPSNSQAAYSPNTQTRIIITPDESTLQRLHRLAGHSADKLRNIIQESFKALGVEAPEVTGVSNVVIAFATPAAIASANNAISEHNLSSATDLLKKALGETLLAVEPMSSAAPAFI